MTATYSVSETSKKLTPKQALLLEAMIAGNAIVVAAKIAGCSEKTAHTWLKLDQVKQAYRKAQNDLFTNSLQGLQAKVDRAIDTLDRHMDSDETPAAQQIRAAQIVIEQSLAIYKMGELEDLQARVELLERLQEGQGNKNDNLRRVK